MSMRKLIRSISPFSKKNINIDDPGPSVPVRPPSPSSQTKPTWSLHGVDFLSFLRVFYQRFNPQKVSAIDFIYDQYKGDEMVLIFELAEKYNLSQEEMQDIIDSTKQSNAGILDVSTP